MRLHGGHGSFARLGVPDDCRLVRFPLAAGRWISAADTDAVVLNQMARAVKPGLRAGDTISLSVQGRPVQWRVVGFFTVVGSPEKAYVSASAFSKAIGSRTARAYTASPLSAVVGRVVSTLAFRVPLSLVLSFSGTAGWLGLVAVIASLATAYPALLAARLTVRETLAYE